MNGHKSFALSILAWKFGHDWNAIAVFTIVVTPNRELFLLGDSFVVVCTEIVVITPSYVFERLHDFSEALPELVTLLHRKIEDSQQFLTDRKSGLVRPDLFFEICFR